MLISVGTQSSAANIWFFTAPGRITPGHLITSGARIPPSQVVSLPPLNGVTPPSGKVNFSAVIGRKHNNGVVGLTHVVELLEHHADVVVELLHADFLDAPVFAAFLAQRGGEGVTLLEIGIGMHPA